MSSKQTLINAARSVEWMTNKAISLPEIHLECSTKLKPQIEEQKDLGRGAVDVVLRLVAMFFTLQGDIQKEGSLISVPPKQGLDYLRGLGEICLTTDRLTGDAFTSTHRFTEAIKTAPEGFVQVKAECLMSLYNSLPMTKAQVTARDIWFAIITVAEKNASAKIPPAIKTAADPKSLKKQVLGWSELSPVDRSSFCHRVGSMLLKNEAPLWALSYAQTAIRLNRSSADNVDLLLEASLKDEKTVFFDSIICLLEKPSHAFLPAIEILISGSISDMKTFVESPQMAPLTERGITAESLYMKLRMALAISYGFTPDQVSRQVSLVDLAEHLETTEEEAEAIVAQAITCDAMVGRINQLDRQCCWTNCQPRRFFEEAGIDALDQKLGRLLMALPSKE